MSAGLLLIEEQYTFEYRKHEKVNIMIDTISSTEFVLSYRVICSIIYSAQIIFSQFSGKNISYFEFTL